MDRDPLPFLRCNLADDSRSSCVVSNYFTWLCFLLLSEVGSFFSPSIKTSCRLLLRLERFVASSSHFRDLFPALPCTACLYPACLRDWRRPRLRLPAVSFSYRIYFMILLSSIRRKCPSQRSPR